MFDLLQALFVHFTLAPDPEPTSVEPPATRLLPYVDPDG